MRRSPFFPGSARLFASPVSWQSFRLQLFAAVPASAGSQGIRVPCSPCQQHHQPPLQLCALQRARLQTCRHHTTLAGLLLGERCLSPQTAASLNLQFDLAALARWSRIALVRELSSAAAADGGALGSKFGSKFARQARESAAERQKRYQQKCQIIFDRQVLCIPQCCLTHGSVIHQYVSRCTRHPIGCNRCNIHFIPCGMLHRPGNCCQQLNTATRDKC